MPEIVAPSFSRTRGSPSAKHDAHATAMLARSVTSRLRVQGIVSPRSRAAAPSSPPLAIKLRAFSSAPPPHAPMAQRNFWPPKEDPHAIALYDGSCPLCAREIAWLRTFKAAPRVAFVNIAAPDFDEDAWFASRALTKPRVALEDEMHVLDARTNVLHSRVAAFRVLYAALGYDVLRFTTRAPFDRIADGVYEFIRLHKHRVAWLA